MQDILKPIYCLILIVLNAVMATARADDFEGRLLPLLNDHCVGCHGDADANAGINFEQLATRSKWLDSPEHIQRVLKAIDNGAMPPEEEEPLNDAQRGAAVAILKTILRDATADVAPPQQPLNRLNRFQYNNTVRDLFQLNRDVFALPEKLMTRHDNYLQSSLRDAKQHTLPERVQVACNALSPLPGHEGVRPFPKDLRAEHGFDNQANQLTLSPLLLDAFLQLSVSIVESPDFNAESVGIWNDLFASPANGQDLPAIVRKRLEPFLRRAFRGHLDEATIDRYSSYMDAQLDAGVPFTDAMKKVAAAALSSPLFLYRSSLIDDDRSRQLTLGSRLSYFLWGSCPDDELLDLAGRGELLDSENLRRTVDRMLVDPKIERFLDSFPSQWMQLENLMAATPDPAINRYFSLVPETPASLQMVLEPLLLFDAVFVEDRPVTELISPSFSYQSEFLTTWYHSELQSPQVDEAAIVAKNEQRAERRRELRSRIEMHQEVLKTLEMPVREQILAVRRGSKGVETQLELKPLAAWEFNGNLRDAIGDLHLTAHGEVSYADGMVLLDKSYLLSEPLPVDLREKSLEVRFRIANLDQRGGGLMGIQGQGDFFDTIVIGERKNRHWISGSNGFKRTLDFDDSFEETVTDESLHLLMVYAEDGVTTLYRNGQPYGESFNKGRDTFPKDASKVIFGLRHLPPGGNRFLSVRIDQARLYDRALSAEEAAAAAAGDANFILTSELVAAMTEEQRSQREGLLMSIQETQEELASVPENIDLTQARETARKQYEEDLRRQLRGREFRRVALDDLRYGGIITNAAMASMTSGPRRTHPVARGVWITEVILNDPPAPPPNDVPPLNEEAGDQGLTIRERFAAHRQNPSCAGCHSKLDPLGFALENYDITGRWRETYENGRDVDVTGMLLRKYEFDNVVEFKASLVNEKRRFAEAFTAHLLRFALGRELHLRDTLVVDTILQRTTNDDYKLRTLIREVILSPAFQ